MDSTGWDQRGEDERATPVYSEEDLARIDPSVRRSPRPEDLAGTCAGSYRLVRVLGTGGLSSVWLGEHPVIGSRVAVKVLHANVSECEEAVRRFVVEAQAVNRIESPHVVRVFDFGRLADGRDYAVMELLEGETLGDRLARVGRMSWHELRPIAIQIARALLAAHRAGILHRDLKPDNIFLSGDHEQPLVKVLDFGIAKLLDDGEPSPRRRTGPGVAVGTPLYAAPEQAAGESLGPEADIYSLGVVLYEALGGRPPFCGGVAQVLSAKVSQLPPPLSRFAPEVPTAVARLVDSMVAATPLERPASAALLLDSLEQGVYEELAYALAPVELPSELPSVELSIEPPPLPPLLEEQPEETPLEPAPPAESPLEAPVPRSEAGPDDRYLPAVATGVGVAPAPARPARIVLLLGAVAILVAASVIAVALVLEARRAGDRHESSAPASLVLPLPAPAPEAAPLPEQPAPPLPRPASAPAPAERPRPRIARSVLLESEPPGALVKLQGRPLGQTPLKLRIDRELRAVTLTIEKAGYRSVSRTIASLDRRLRVELVPEAWVDPFREQ